MAKAAGADDIIDVVVPRAAIPRYMAAVAEVAEEHGALVTGCGHVGDGNVHLSVFQPDPERRTEVLRAVFRAGMDLGGAISGEHGIGTEKKKYFLELEDPVKVELMRRHQARLRPPRDPRARQPPRLTDGLPTHERRPGTHPDPRRQRGRRLLRQPGDLGDALRGRARRRARDAGRPRAVRGRGHRRRRRLRPHGAADPAATLLHLGPGLGNGIANLHNARRARTPIVNVVGDHATYHIAYDPPLASDIESLARPVSRWFRSSATPEDARRRRGGRRGRPRSGPRRGGHPRGAGRRVVAGSRRARRRAGPAPASPRWPTRPWTARPRRCGRASRPCSSSGGNALRERGLVAASRVAGATGAKLLCETFPARLERGAGLPAVERLGYLAEFTIAQLAGGRALVLADALAPVSFFAYPGMPGYLVPDGCEVHTLATGSDDVAGALEALADALGAAAERRRHRRPPRARTGRPARSTPQSLAAAIGALLPEGAIVSDEGNTSGLFVSGATAGAPRHDWLCLTGGAIGQGLPVATGAAVACPDRPVLSPRGRRQRHVHAPVAVDPGARGSRRDDRDLQQRLVRHLGTGAQPGGCGRPGPPARGMLDLKRPDLDFVAPGLGHGRPRHAGDDRRGVHRHNWSGPSSTPGPALVEAVLRSPAGRPTGRST